MKAKAQHPDAQTTEARPLAAIGLMSGTSMDGIDAAMLTTDGHKRVKFGPTLHYPYEDSLRRRLLTAHSAASHLPDLAQLERDITLAHAQSVKALLRSGKTAAEKTDVLGFHGQTLAHRPQEGRSLQIGDGALLAETTGIATVNDFRSRDLRHGGQGAPLAALFHAILAEPLPHPLAVANIGGVANITWLPAADADPVAFDAGPGCALLDELARKTLNTPLDRNGAFALSGQADPAKVAAFLKDPWFAKTPPKSLDKHHWQRRAGDAIAGLAPADAAATLAAITAAGLIAALTFLRAQPTRLILCGGGRRNGAIHAALRTQAPPSCKVCLAEDVGWDGDFLEAQAFAWLAVRSLKELPLTLPSTTGAPRPLSGGVLHKPLMRP